MKVGSVIIGMLHVGLVRSVALCGVCTAVCVMESDLISGPRSDPTYHIHTGTTGSLLLVTYLWRIAHKVQHDRAGCPQKVRQTLRPYLARCAQEKGGNMTLYVSTRAGGSRRFLMCTQASLNWTVCMIERGWPWGRAGQPLKSILIGLSSSQAANME
jgi:hypothetical protein